MLVLALIGILLVTVPIAGGSLAALGRVPLRAGWLLGLALGVQILVISVIPQGPHRVLSALHMASYLAAGAFAWLNRRTAGVPVISAGGAMNGLAIAANGGTMPAAPSALARAGITVPADAFLNSGPVASPHLALLGDVLAVPSWLPLANVVSIGDIVIVGGIGYGLHRICGSRLIPGRPAAVAAHGAQDVALSMPWCRLVLPASFEGDHVAPGSRRRTAR